MVFWRVAASVSMRLHMSAFSWIQLAGLGQILDERWPDVRNAVCADIERLGSRAGPQLLVCLGPLTSDGSDEGFAKFARRLDELRRAFPGERLAVVALPGDCDVAAVDPRDPRHRSLRHWHSDAELADKLFWEPDSEYRALVREWFTAFQQWSETWPIGQVEWTRQPGLVPGDAAWRATIAGARIGVLALSTSYLQPALQDSRGVLHPRQLHAACDGDAPAWLSDCDIALLVTTHPTDVLHPHARAALRELVPPERQSAHLSGPGDDSRSEARNGTQPRHSLCVPPLDPPDAAGGYLVGRIELGEPPTLRVWPRALRRGDLGLRCTADVERWELLADEGTSPVPLRDARPTESVRLSRDLRDALVDRGVDISPEAFVVGTLGADDDTLEPLTELPVTRNTSLCITAAPPLERVPAAPLLSDGGRWICGASLAELADKLVAEEPPILGWDGAPLQPDAIVQRHLQSHDPAERQRDGDPLWRALLAVARAGSPGRTRGVLVIAEPGAGKTVWSRTLTWSFRDGAFGMFGGAAWRSARDLAETIRVLPGAAWHEWLAQREPTRAAAFAALERSRRLVVIIDGLDEVGLAALAQIEAALPRVPGLWICTRRPGGGDDRSAADIVRLHLVELTTNDREHLLASLGRLDLARGAYRQRSGTRLLTADTPLLLAVIARIVQPGEDPDAVPQDQLFDRFFATLLQQAQRDRRLSAEGSQLLKLLVGSVVGTLAMLWLQGGARPLDATRIEVVLEDLPSAQRMAALDALEFGYLLRPIEGGWEFAHRTLAEWAAAAAVHRNVERRLLSDPHAAAEHEVLAPLLDEPGPRNHGRWSQLLRFYAPHIVDPVGLLTTLIGPDAALHWRHVRNTDGEPAHPPAEYEVTNTFSAELDLAIELLTRCRWATGVAARRCWSLVARAWLLCHREREHSVPQLARGFLDGLAPHLPSTLGEIVALFAVDAAAHAQLTADPTPLLPVLPVESSRSLTEHLISAPPAQQFRIIRWANAQGADLPVPWLRDATFSNSALEAEAWQAVIRLGEEPLWPSLRRCAAEWPDHLAQPLRAWFARSPRSRFPADSVDHRKVVLGIVLSRSTAAHTDLDEFLANGEPVLLAQIAGGVLARLRDRERTSASTDLRALLRARGIEVLDRARDTPEAQVDALEHRFDAAVRWHSHVCTLVGALERADLDAVAGGLWRSLPADAAERPRLIAAFRDVGKWPAAVALASILAAEERSGRLRHALAPSHLDALRRLADEQPGVARFKAVLRLADAESRDPVVALLHAFRAGDPGYEAALLAHLEDNPPPGSALRGVLASILSGQGHLAGDTPPSLAMALSDELLVRLPLAYQAFLNAPGWRGRLLDALDDDDELEPMIRLASTYVVREALAPLVARLERLPDGPAPWDIPLYVWLSAVAALCPDHDHALGRRAIRAMLAHAAPRDRSWHGPIALARFVTPADIPLLLAVDGAVLQEPALRDRLRAMGQPAFDALLPIYRTSSVKPRRILHELLLAIADPARVPLAVVLELCADLRYDGHTLLDAQNPFVADLDEPEDQGWHFRHIDRSIELLGPLLAACTQARPDSWSALEPLLAHPSVLLRARAFAAIIEHAPWDSVRMRDMLARVLTAPPPPVQLAAGLVLAAGRTDTNAEIHKAWSEVQSHLEAVLGFQHEAFLVLLTHSSEPRLRAAGARWLGTLGIPAWISHLAPLLADPSFDVVAAALRAMLRLDAAQAPAALDASLRTTWTPHHYAVVIQAAHGPTSSELYRGASTRERLKLPADLAFVLLDEAAALEPQRRERGETVFSGFPSACEQLVDRLDCFDAAVVGRWITSPCLSVRAVARRLLAAHAALDPAPLLALLTANDPADRLSAAECLTRLHCTAHAKAILAGWRACHDQRNEITLPHDLRDGLWQIGERLLWAIHEESATTWIPLLDLALRHIPHDSEDMTPTAHGELLIAEGCRILRGLDLGGVREFVAAMDAGRIEENFEFTEIIVARARMDAALRDELRRLADAGGQVARGLLGEATNVPVDPRYALAERLRRNVFVV